MGPDETWAGTRGYGRGWGCGLLSTGSALARSVLRSRWCIDPPAHREQKAPLQEQVPWLVVAQFCVGRRGARRRYGAGGLSSARRMNCVYSVLHTCLSLTPRSTHRMHMRVYHECEARVRLLHHLSQRHLMRIGREHIGGTRGIKGSDMRSHPSVGSGPPPPPTPSSKVHPR